MKKTLIRGGSLVQADGLLKADVLISVTGEIEQIGSVKNHKDADIIEAEGHLLFPLLIDCHVHFREPGLEHKATMETEAAAALAGGVGCVCEMPNTIPPTVTVAALADKVRRAALIDGCDIKFFFGVTEAIHLQALRDLWTGTSMELRRLKQHCCGVKLYLDHSTGNQKIDGLIIEDVFTACAELKIPIVAHCEDPEMNDAAKKSVTDKNISAHSTMRPAESEAKSIQDAIALVKKTGAHLHIAHLSTKLGVDLVRSAKKEKLSVTCEAAPHHLLLTIDDYATLGTFAKMNPPLRTAEDRDALWMGVLDGTIDCISTDHAPHTLDEKQSGEPLSAPSGVPGVETMLPLLLSCAGGHWPHPNGKQPVLPGDKHVTYETILRACFMNPDKIFPLHQFPIETGVHARICIVDPNKEWTIEGKRLHAKCGWTPFEGWKVKGAVIRTITH